MKIKKDMEDISTKPMNISSGDMYKFEEKQMIKKVTIRETFEKPFE